MTTSLQTTGNQSLSTFFSQWEQKNQLAIMLVKSGFLPPTFKTPEQVMAVMLTAHELNIPPMQALRSIHVIQGKPTVSPQLMMALINRSGTLEDIRIEDNGDMCVVEMKRLGRAPHSESFSMMDAKAMGLADKGNWREQARTMRKWRAVSACARVVFPDVITGLYTPEEMGADVEISDDGEATVTVAEVLPTIEHQPEIQNTEPAKEIPATVVPDPSPEEPKAAMSFKGFDAEKEIVGAGKYQGKTWAELPDDYLLWVKEKHNKKEVRDKAAATISFKAFMGSQLNGK